MQLRSGFITGNMEARVESLKKTVENIQSTIHDMIESVENIILHMDQRDKQFL